MAGAEEQKSSFLNSLRVIGEEASLRKEWGGGVHEDSKNQREWSRMKNKDIYLNAFLGLGAQRANEWEVYTNF